MAERDTQARRDSLRRTYYLQHGRATLGIYTSAHEVLERRGPGKRILCRIGDTGPKREVWPGREL